MNGINMGDNYYSINPEKIANIINNQCAIDATIRRVNGSVKNVENEVTNMQIKNAALLKQLIELLKPISHHFEEEYKEWRDKVAEENRAAGIGVSIDELELSVRSYNCLKRAGLGTVDKVIEEYRHKGSLKHIRNLGRRSEAEVISRLVELGYMQEVEE